MPQIEHDEQQQAADPQSQPLPPLPITQGNEEDDDPDEIFFNAVAEIDTQPLVKVKRKRAETTLTIGDVLEIACIVSVLLFGLLGSIYLALTYPHTLVILYAKTIPATLTAPLDIPTRQLAPVSITRSATIQTTGTGHQEARTATGHVTFYNGLSTGQTVIAGTVLRGKDGLHIATTQDAVIPAADTTTTPPTDGPVSVSAQAVQTGVQGNIAADDVSVVFSPSLTVKNLAAFTGGREARTFKAVAAQDLTTLTSTLNTSLTQALTTAFPMQVGEQDVPTHCHVTTSATHQTGDEAQSVTLTGVKTCAAVAYHRQQLEQQATTAFQQTQPAKHYHLVGSVQTLLKSVSPLTVTMRGNWAYTFTADDQQLLARDIQGDSPAQARAALLKTGVISSASVPQTLPAAEDIDFLVLVD